MERRALLKLVALAAFSPKLNALEVAAACPGQADSVTPPSSDYKLQFFTEDENKLLDQLMEMIIPADSHSPGAHATKTSLFADLMVATSDSEIKKQWRDGLRLIREEARSLSLTEALRKAAENEVNPKTDLERFFVLVKQMTVNGYYTSEVGIQGELGYIGNTYLAAFPECTHPEHQG